MSGNPPRVLAEAAHAYVPRTLEELFHSRKWVIYDPDTRMCYCERRLGGCGARQTPHPIGVDFETPFRKFSCEHQLCGLGQAEAPRKASTVSRAVPPPRTAATPGPRKPAASWHDRNEEGPW